MQIRRTRSSQELRRPCKRSSRHKNQLGCPVILTLLAASLPYLRFRQVIELHPQAPQTTAPAYPPNICFTVQQNHVQNAALKCYHPIWLGWANSKPTTRSTDADGCFKVDDFLYDTANCHIVANGDCFGTTALDIAISAEQQESLPTLEEARSLGLSALNPAEESTNQLRVELPYQQQYCGDFRSKANGCGPEFLPPRIRSRLSHLLDLEEPCSAHDNCYDDCDTPRSVCDQNLYDDVVRACPSCHWLAQIMFLFVKGPLGTIACDATREPHCSAPALCRA